MAACVATPVTASLEVFQRAVRFVGALRVLYRRERERMRREVAAIPGLYVLLMKSRNGARWTRAERTELRARLQGLGRLSLYVLTLAAPGTEITLPLLAWWLDRRASPRHLTQLS
jgi:hypothetical protein